MRVVINQEHISLNGKLVKECNKRVKSFNAKDYSRIEKIKSVLAKQDISIENKKKNLMEKLHTAIIAAFSIRKKDFSKKAFEFMKRRLACIRSIVAKLRSMNYYLETIFLEDLKLSKIKLRSERQNPKQRRDLARDELEALEYTAYKLIGEAAMLDKKVLKEYAKKEEIIVSEEKIEADELGLLLRKESMLLEHLEAKLPPPKAAEIKLLKEPIFTHWTARVLALLSFLEHTYRKETMSIGKLKKNKELCLKIGRKITYLIKEKSKLLEIMEEKQYAMEKLKLNALKKEFHNLTATMAL